MVVEQKINGVMKLCVQSETGPQPVKFVLELLNAGVSEIEVAEECKITVEQVRACKDSVAMSLTMSDMWKFVERRTAHVHIVKAVCEGGCVADLQSALRGFNNTQTSFVCSEDDVKTFQHILSLADLEKEELLALM